MYIPTNANSESSFFEIAAFNDGHLAAKERAWAFEYFVRVAMVLLFVRVPAIVRVVCHCERGRKRMYVGVCVCVCLFKEFRMANDSLVIGGQATSIVFGDGECGDPL